jgi:hypothetical protein
MQTVAASTARETKKDFTARQDTRDARRSPQT